MTDWYQGTGVKRKGSVPPATSLKSMHDPSGYLAEKPLKDAVNVALSLSQPLLVTGDPGTGKTQLAHALAHELDLRLLVFNTKTTAVARDLFYRYDALRHFRDVHLRGKKDNGVERKNELEDEDVNRYIDFEALGLAILLAKEPGERPKNMPADLQSLERTRCVVLIDEIDKAPRDLPNDVLNEIQEMCFTVSETRQTYQADQEFRPILVLTSNSEKNLPDPFLRRCVYYHVPVPGLDRLKTIVKRRLNIGDGDDQKDALITNAVAHFQQVRDSDKLKKPPATAELISWVRVLMESSLDLGRSLSREQAEALRVSYSALAKTREDLEYLQGLQPTATA